VSETVSPIFVIGTGRSGTTLLRLMLCAHPRIYITHEASFYVWEAQYSRRAPRRAFLDYYFRTASFRWLRLDPNLVLAGLPDPLPQARVGDAYAAVMRQKALVYGRPRFGDKTPSHAASLARIFQDFPDARVVHIVRDPRDTAVSLSHMPWASASLWANAAFCEIERRQVAKYRDRILQIRLEDLLVEPRSTMAAVLDFVGEPWDDAVLDHSRNAPDKHDMPPVPWLESAAKDRRPPSPTWLRLRPAEIRMIERVTRRIMADAGYPRAELPEEPSRLSVVWTAFRQCFETVRFLTVYLRIALRLRDARAFDSPDIVELLRRVNPGSWARYPGFHLPLPPQLPAAIRTAHGQ
jgi:hypothetical protein